MIDEIYTLITQLSTIGIVLALAAIMNHLFQTDATSTFLGGNIKKDVCWPATCFFFPS